MVKKDVNIVYEQENRIVLHVGDAGQDMLNYHFFKNGEDYILKDNDGFTVKIWLTPASGIGATLRKSADGNYAIGSVYPSITKREGEYKAIITIKNPFEEENIIFENILFVVEP